MTCHRQGNVKSLLNLRKKRGLRALRCMRTHHVLCNTFKQQKQLLGLLWTLGASLKYTHATVSTFVGRGGREKGGGGGEAAEFPQTRVLKSNTTFPQYLVFAETVLQQKAKVQKHFFLNSPRPTGLLPAGVVCYGFIT